LPQRRALRSRQREIFRRLVAEGRPWLGDNAVVSSDCWDGCKPTSLTVAPLLLQATNARPAIGRDERQHNSTFKGGTKRRRLCKETFNGDGEVLSYLRNVRTTKDADRCADHG
jgi:hypothetical protein